MYTLKFVLIQASRLEKEFKEQHANMKDVKNVTPGTELSEAPGVSRRRFLGYAGGLAGAGLLIASCEKENKTPETAATADLGTHDEGLLNLVLVLQQVEADFYERMLANKYQGMTQQESAYFMEMQKHEIAHREVLRNYLKSKGTVVKTDFSSVDFNSKQNVLETIELIENLGIATVNEISRLLISVEHVALVLKIASVEARHASTISNMLSKGAFFNTLDASGSEQGSLPSNTINTINRFLATKVSGNNLPNK